MTAINKVYYIEVRFLTVNKNVIKKVVEIWRVNIFPPSFWIFNKMTIKLWFLLPMKMMIPFKFPFSHQMWQIKRSHNKASREKYSGQDFDSHKYRVGKIGLSSCTYWGRNGSTKGRQCRKRILSHRRSNKKQEEIMNPYFLTRQGGAISSLVRKKSKSPRQQIIWLNFSI